MDIKCERCGTEYEFDDNRVTEDGVTVKCSSCGHLFKVRKKSFVLTEPVPQDGPEADAVEKNWMVRKPDGTMLSFKELTTLQKWIVERRVSRDDEISKSGETWKRLGSIAELASFFLLVDQANAVSQPPVTQPPVTQPQSTATMAAMPTQGMPAASQPVMPVQGTEAPASQPVMPAQGTAAPASQPVMPVMGAAQEPDSWGDGGYDPTSEDVVEKWKKRGRRKWFVIVPLLLILAGLGLVYVVAPEKIQGIADDLFGSDKEKTKSPASADGQSKGVLLAPDGNGAKDVADAGVEDDAGISADDLKTDDGATSSDKSSSADSGMAKDAKKTKSTGSQRDQVGEQPAMGYDALMAKADRLQRAGRSAKALEAYDEALALKPQDVEALTGKGLCLLDMGSNASAVSNFKKALRINPRYGDAIMGAAEAYKYKKDTANAIKYYKKYLDVLPDGPEAAVARSNLEQLK